MGRKQKSPNKPVTPVWTWRHAIAEADVPSLTKLLCYTVALRLTDCGQYVRISVAEICRLSKMSERSVAGHVQIAAGAGLMSVTRLHNRAGHVIGTDYYPKFPNGAVLDYKPARETLDYPPAESAVREPKPTRSTPEPNRRSCGSIKDNSPNKFKEGGKLVLKKGVITDGPFLVAVVSDITPEQIAENARALRRAVGRPA